MVDLNTNKRTAEARGTGKHGAIHQTVPGYPQPLPIDKMGDIRMSMVRRANEDTWLRRQDLFSRYGRTYSIEEVFSQTDTFNTSLGSGDYGPWESHVIQVIDQVKFNSAKYRNVPY